MAKGTSKVIVVAERNRRTPGGNRRIEIRWFDGFGNGENGETAKKLAKMGPKASKIHQNGSLNRSKINQKSKLRPKGVQGWFWDGRGTQNDQKGGKWTKPFGDHFLPKIEKKASKNASKNRCRKRVDILHQNCKKGSQNVIQNR